MPREDALANCPDRDEIYFKVPRIVKSNLPDLKPDFREAILLQLTSVQPTNYTTFY